MPKSMARTRTLYDYQAEHCAGILRKRKSDHLVVAPTGSGKTTTGATIAAAEMRAGATHVLIAAPQDQINDGFIACNDTLIRWPEGFDRRPVTIPSRFIRPVEASGSITKAIIAYLADPAPGYAIAITHAALTALIRLHGSGSLPELLRHVMIIDEAHHMAAEGLSLAVAAWHAAGGRVRGFTATAHRGDGKKVGWEGVIVHTRTLAEQMIAGLCPSKFASEMVPFTVSKPVTGAEFTGEAVTDDPQGLDALSRLIVAKWLEDGRPKAIVRVPPMRGGCGPLVALLVDRFRKADARVVDSTGPGKEKQARFLDMLRDERGRDFNASQHDVIIGSQRIVEGTDWPVCSDIYSVGLPASLLLFIQMLGRASRRKASTHPRWDVMKFTALVPSAGGDTLDALSLEYSKHALLVSVFIADHETGEELLWPWGVGADLEKYARVKLAMLAEVEAKGEPTVGELVEAAKAAVPDAEDWLIDYVAVRLLVAEPVEPTKGGSAPEPLKARVKLGPDVDDSVKERLAEVVREFRGSTLVCLGSLRALGRQMHAMTGDDTRKMAERFKEAGYRPLTEEMITVWVKEWHKRTGNWPNQRSGEIPDSEGETWRAIHCALYDGARGLPGGSSLFRFLANRFGVRDRYNSPLDERLIKRYVSEWHTRTGSWPNLRSGEIPGTGGETWCAIDQAINKGGRGLPGGSSLFKFIGGHFHDSPHATSIAIGTKKQSNNSPLDERLIKRYVSEWHTRTGSWPHQRSGKIPGAGGETWCAINGALFRGSRGLPGGSSLIKFIGGHFHDSTLAKRIAIAAHRPLTEELIKRYVAEWRIRTDSWPHQRSGQIPNSGGETWGNIAGTLFRGGRGLLKISTLFKFIAEHFPDSPQAKKIASRRPKQILPTDPTPPSDLPRPQTDR